MLFWEIVVISLLLVLVLGGLGVAIYEICSPWRNKRKKKILRDTGGIGFAGSGEVDEKRIGRL